MVREEATAATPAPPGDRNAGRTRRPTTFIATNAAQFAADIAAVNNTPGPNTILLAEGDYYLGGTLKIVNADNLTIRSRLNNAADVRIIATTPAGSWRSTEARWTSPR